MQKTTHSRVCLKLRILIIRTLQWRLEDIDKNLEKTCLLTLFC